MAPPVTPALPPLPIPPVVPQPADPHVTQKAEESTKTVLTNLLDSSNPVDIAKVTNEIKTILEKTLTPEDVAKHMVTVTKTIEEIKKTKDTIEKAKNEIIQLNDSQQKVQKKLDDVVKKDEQQKITYTNLEDKLNGISGRIGAINISSVNSEILSVPNIISGTKQGINRAESTQRKKTQELQTITNTIKGHQSSVRFARAGKQWYYSQIRIERGNESRKKQEISNVQRTINTLKDKLRKQEKLLSEYKQKRLDYNKLSADKKVIGEEFNKLKAQRDLTLKELEDATKQKADIENSIAEKTSIQTTLLNKMKSLLKVFKFSK